MDGFLSVGELLVVSLSIYLTLENTQNIEENTFNLLDV